MIDPDFSIPTEFYVWEGFLLACSAAAITWALRAKWVGWKLVSIAMTIFFAYAVCAQLVRLNYCAHHASCELLFFD